MFYQVKRIHDREKIEQCNKFQISHYMWDSKVEPKAYGWMGYIDGEGLFVKMICEESNPKRVYKNHKDPVYKDSAMEIFFIVIFIKLVNQKKYCILVATRQLIVRHQIFTCQSVLHKQ